MKRLSLLYILFIISILAQSCRKDIDEIEMTPPDIPVVTKVISSIHGTVSDDLGNAVSDAFVNLEDETTTTTTDENGVFQFINKSMNENGTYISVQKEGFYLGSRRFYPSIGNTSRVQIELIPLEIVGTFNSEDAGTISHNGIVLDFPANAIANQDGSAFSGTVNVAAEYLDPTNPGTLDQMPGDLTGISTEDGLVALTSLGMITVELLDDAGNELQVKNGSLVKVKIPIPSDLQATAPSTIPMWHFNEDLGIWEEEGFAELTGDHYETSLAHFSFWNCDIPNDYIFISGTVINREVPLQGATVLIVDNNNNTSGYGITDVNGKFSGFIPNDSDLSIIIYNNCGDEVYNQSFSTGSEDIVLATIVLFVEQNYANITGTISFCDSEFSDYAYVKIENGINNSTFPIAANGSFTGSIFYCNPGDPIIVTGIDPLNALVSGEYFYEIEGDINVGNIEICDQGFTEHLIVEYGDVKWNLPFDDKVFNLFDFHSDVINGGDEGYILRSIYEPEPDSIHIFKFYMPFVEGSPMQDCRVEYIKTSNNEGNAASGTYSGQIVTFEGTEYLHATGTLTDPIFHNPNELDNEPIYFDVLIKNIN